MITCGQCRFWVPQDAANGAVELGNRPGFCKRFPPTPIPLMLLGMGPTSPVTNPPVSAGFGSCGEFVKNESWMEEDESD